MKKPQQRPPAKKLTREVVQANPLLGALARQRLKEIKAVRRADAEGQLKLK